MERLLNKLKGKSENVNADVLRKICAALNRALDDIVKITSNKPNNLEGEVG